MENRHDRAAAAIDWADKCAAIERELAFRRRVYPRRVEEGRMTAREAERQIAIMEAIHHDYTRWLFSCSTDEARLICAQREREASQTGREPTPNGEHQPALL